MCNDNGSRPGAEAIAIIHAISPAPAQSLSSSTTSSATSSRETSPSPSAYCKILFSNKNPPSTPDSNDSEGQRSTSYHCSGLSDLLPQDGKGSHCELQLLSQRYPLRENAHSDVWTRLHHRIELGVGENGVVGRAVSLVCDGVEIGRGVVGWGDL